MKRIILDYDEMSGQLYDANSLSVCGMLGMVSFEPEDSATTTDDLIKLKNAGFETDDIVELRRKELI